MCEAPGSVVTLLCSGIQLYSAERRVADCILADVKRASMCTSAELARLSCSSEATIQAIDTRQLRQILSLLRSCEVYKEICLSQLSKEEVAKTL